MFILSPPIPPVNVRRRGRRLKPTRTRLPRCEVLKLVVSALVDAGLPLPFHLRRKFS
jgi:hypothetical protein